MSSSKRRRVEAEADKAEYVRLVDEELCQLVGGQKLLLESEFTKAALLQFIKAKGFIREVKGVAEVTPQRENSSPNLIPQSKRGRVEAEAKKAKYVRLVDQKLHQLVGGQKLLLESELTRADLLLFLKAKGFIWEVKGVVEVLVQTMDGGSFGVRLEEGGTVADLKSEIQEAQGAALYRQQLFMLGEGAEGGSEVQEPLSDDQEIGGSCMVMLCMQSEEEWSWDASSPLLERNVLELRGPNNRIAAKIAQDLNNNCVMAGPVMEARTGTHTISMQLATQDGAIERIEGIVCGVVSDGTACDQDPVSKSMSSVAWLMSSGSGSLYGHGKSKADSAGGIDSGDVLTMQVDTDAGTLRYWRNGEPHGPGFTSGVTGPLRWATSIEFVGDIVAIVPTPAAMQLWSLPPPSLYLEGDQQQAYYPRLVRRVGDAAYYAAL